MKITGYHREDLDRIVEINEKCYSGIYCPPRDTVRDYVSVSDVFVTRVTMSEEKVVGFAIVRDVKNPYVWNIAVDPEWQGRGIGGNLLREIIKTYTLSKRDNISLHCNVNNPAQKLYFDYGFRVVSVEEDYFAPDDGLSMRRALP